MNFLYNIQKHFILNLLFKTLHIFLSDFSNAVLCRFREYSETALITCVYTDSVGSHCNIMKPPCPAGNYCNCVSCVHPYVHVYIYTYVHKFSNQFSFISLDQQVEKYIRK